jgi:uncharacterized protein (TIGR03437 family)
MQSRWLISLLGILPLAATPAAAQSTATVTYSYSGIPLPILVDNADAATLIRVAVPQGIRIQKVTAKVDVEYPTVGDINLFLFSPEGTRTRLLERNCGSRGTLRDTTFDDAAPSKYSEFCPVEAGRAFRGNEPLSNSVGQNGLGYWTLAVENNGSNDKSGWVLGFSVTITGQVIVGPAFTEETVLNSSTLRPGPIAPGSMISIFGSGLGPDEPVQAPGTTMPTTLGGVTVQIAHITEVALKSVSKYRIDCQVPFASMQPGGLTPIVVNNGGKTSAPVYIELSSTAPGLVTVGPIGTGTVVATNEDGSRNTATSPASPGSLIKVAATGLGDTAYAPAPGGPIPVYYPVTASIAGSPAEVTQAVYTGTAGLYTVTLRIPSNTPAGGISVKVSSVGASSQSGALIWVK